MSENSQDYAQKPQRNCTLMNSAYGEKYIGSRSWDCQKLTAEQHLAKAGGTVRHQQHGPSITVQIIVLYPSPTARRGKMSCWVNYLGPSALCSHAEKPKTSMPTLIAVLPGLVNIEGQGRAGGNMICTVRDKLQRACRTDCSR